MKKKRKFYLKIIHLLRLKSKKFFIFKTLFLLNNFFFYNIKKMLIITLALITIFIFLPTTY